MMMCPHLNYAMSKMAMNWNYSKQCGYSIDKTKAENADDKLIQFLPKYKKMTSSTHFLALLFSRRHLVSFIQVEFFYYEKTEETAKTYLKIFYSIF